MVSRAMPVSALMALVLLAASMSACDEAQPTATTTPTTTPTAPTPRPTDVAFVHPTFQCGSTLPGFSDFYPDSLLWTPDSSELVFSVGGDIWRVDADGVYLQRVLGANPNRGSFIPFMYGFHADLSPDGSQLAYTSCQFQTEDEVDPGGYPPDQQWWAEIAKYTYEIALSGLDGEDQQRLTHSRWLDHYPVWSPNGDLIAFLSSDGTSRFDDSALQLYTMLMDGSDVHILVPELKGLAKIPPVWSPDGRRLAFVVDEEYRRAIYTVRSNGLDLVRIGETNPRSNVGFPPAAPTWSSDSERVAFAAFDGEEAIVHSVRYDGTDLRRVWSSGPDNNVRKVTQVSWSPDGSEIFFVYSGINGTSYYDGIYVVRPDGSGLRSLDFRGSSILAAWSPDGSRIAVYDARTAGYGPISIGTLSRDGTDLRVLVEVDRNDEPWLAQSTQPEATTEPDAHFSVVLDTTGGPVVVGEELRIDFWVTNEALKPASGVTLAFEVNYPSTLITVRATHGACEGSTCDLGSFDGYESVSGHVVVIPKLGFDVRVDAELSWPLSNSDRGHAYAQLKAPLADNNRPGALIWATSTSASDMDCEDSVGVGPEAVYAGFGSQLYAVSRSSGEALWRRVMDGWVFEPVFADGHIYFYTAETEEGIWHYYVHSLDASNGTSDWKYFVEGAPRFPITAYDGSVYLTANGPEFDGRPEYNYLMSLDASTGNMNWQYRVDKWINTPAVEFGDYIYFGTYSDGDDYLYSIDPRSGELSQRYRTEGGSYNTPLFSDGTVYIVRWDSLYSMDLSTGRKDWEYRPGGIPAETPVLSDGSLYFRVYNEEAREFLSVHAIDAATGSLKWKHEQGTQLNPPAASNGSIYVPSYSNLVSLDASTGSRIWLGDYRSICAPMTAADGVLYGRANRDGERIIFAIRAH